MLQASVFILQIPDGRTIFVKRAATKKRLPNKWSLPAGTIEEGESPEETTIREVKEEFNLSVSNPVLFKKKSILEKDKVIYFFKIQIDKIPEILDYAEMSELRAYTFKEFFATFADEDIGDGLKYLRKEYAKEPLLFE